MPAFLRKHGDVLHVTLGGLEHAEFKETLARVKSIPGKQWRPELPNKPWVFPADADTALRIMMMIEPVTDAETQAMVREHTQQVAADLVTKLPDDATLEVNPTNHAGHGLRPYQRAGIAFLMEHPRTIVADEMGLGKTVTAITTVLEARARRALDAAAGFPPHGPDDVVRDGATLIVAPKAMLGTWRMEIADWAGEDAVVIDAKTAPKRLAQAKEALASGARWIVVNWEQLRQTKSNAPFVKLLAAQQWAAVVADEAHRAKNKDAAQTKGLWKMEAPIRLAMTGTPIMAHPGELWSLLRWLQPEQYRAGGDYWPFYYSYVDEYKTRYGRVVTGVKNVDQLRFELADKLIRRTKADVLTDLPPKTVQHVRVPMKPKQEKLYREAEDAFVLEVKQAVEEGKASAEAVQEALEAGDAQSLMYLLENGAARTTRLRQIASSPAILGGEDESAKMDAAVEIIRDNPGEPFVVFTWFEPAARIMAERLRRGKPALRVGTIAGDDEADPVKDAFQNGELDVIVATIAKGGVGLTLTRAATAIFVDRDWTPAINQQAEDRLHRLGQERPVEIIVLEADGTIDTGSLANANRLKTLITNQVLGTDVGEK